MGAPQSSVTSLSVLGTGVPTRSCSSVKRGEQGGKGVEERGWSEMCNAPLFPPSNLIHLTENEQDASRGAKQQALKQERIVLCCPHQPENSVKGSTHECEQTSLSASLSLCHSSLRLKCRPIVKDCDGIAFYSPLNGH